MPDVEHFFESGRNEDAFAKTERALSLNPENVDTLNTRGLLLEEIGRYDDALSDFDHALALQPDHPDALNNKGLILARLGRFEDALGYFEQVLLHYPERMQARYNRSIMLLALGDLANGFREFETRWQIPPLKDLKHPTPVPLWRGEAVARGKTILIYHEQGYGDTLQFARYVPMVIERGMKVVLAVPPALRQVMETLPGAPTVVTEGDPMPHHELRCPLMSLPLAFGTTLDTIPASQSYLKADPKQVDHWKKRLGHSTKPRIGLVWSGRQYPPINSPRDMTLDTLSPLLGLDADLISLQKEIPKVDQALIGAFPKLARYGEELTDFAATAALIEHLDLVITVDTSVAHLAGALGKSVWIMNRHATCWRWPRERWDSSWYPSVRVFRQKVVGQWNEVVDDIRSAAEALIVEGRPFESFAPSGPKQSEVWPSRLAGTAATASQGSVKNNVDPGRAVEKIKFVCATRESSEEFFTKTALGRSLMNFRSFPRGQPIELRVFQKNTASLPSVYNIAIEESRNDPAILVFIHDDVLLCDFYWSEHLIEALEMFSIVGLCGNKRRVPGQCSWMFLDSKFTRDDDANLSGVVGHGKNFPTLQQLSVYGPPRQEVKLLDGLMLSVRSGVLLDSGLRFDPQFDFHFYDMDFCRQAEARQLRMGTCAMSIVHESAGHLGSTDWILNYRKYLDKYGE